MYRNQYDTEVVTFSPAGRLHQVEYAMEAVKQGSACVGLRSSKFAVLASLKRSTSELAAYQQKVFKVDEHMGIAIAGLIADGRVLRKYMIQECLNHRFVFETPLPVGRLVASLADKAQYYTQRMEKRPYGVGLLVAGYDRTGAHIYQTDPSGNAFEYVAQAMGARSQSAKTYLEKHFETFTDANSLEDLIDHAVRALQGASQNGKLHSRNVSIAFVGEGTPFRVLTDDEVRPHVIRAIGEEAENSDDDEKDPTIVDDDAPAAGRRGAAGGAGAEEEEEEDAPADEEMAH